MPLILPSNSISAGGYEVANSLRFNDGSSDYIYKNFSADTEKNQITCSFWIKRGSIGSTQRILSHMTSGFVDYFYIRFESDEKLHFHAGMSSGSLQFDTTQVFRDNSAWSHIVIAMDTTQGTDTNRVKIYVNGVQLSNFDTSIYPNQNATASFGKTDAPIVVGGLYGAGYGIGSGSPQEFYDGYISEIVFIDGQQLTADSFGEFDQDSGIWKPIDVSGLTFGTNGFYLPFENSGALGQDDSGNGNNFTVNNLTSIDQTTDTPTNNYATMNPLANQGTVAFSDGNLSTTITGSSGNASGSIFANKGKWYFECKITNSDNKLAFGIMRDTTIYTTSDIYQVVGTIVYYSGNGQIFDNIPTSSGGVSSPYGSTFTNNDIISCALDLDNGYLYFAKNGTWQNSGVPTSGATGTGGISIPTDSYFTALLGSAGLTPSSSMNFGNPPFTISSGNSDANGYGNFEYSVPSGYYALNTKNLAEYG